MLRPDVDKKRLKELKQKTSQSFEKVRNSIVNDVLAKHQPRIREEGLVPKTTEITYSPTYLSQDNRTPKQIEQDIKRTEKINNAKIRPAQAFLGYLSDPSRVLGDMVEPLVGTPFATRNPFNTSKELATELEMNRQYANGFSDLIRGTLDIAGRELPSAVVNTALGAIFAPSASLESILAETILPFGDIRTPTFKGKNIYEDSIDSAFQSFSKEAGQQAPVPRYVKEEQVLGNLRNNVKGLPETVSSNRSKVKNIEPNQLIFRNQDAGAVPLNSKFVDEVYLGNDSPGYKPAMLESIPISNPNIKLLQKDWLKGYKEVPKPKSNFKSNFKSEIDWGKWNKEIPENKALMQEYNAIEQQTKADGTWMKNPDGSDFVGSKPTQKDIIDNPMMSNDMTPEEAVKAQFIQQRSQNHKNAFGKNQVMNPDGSHVIYTHGSPKRFSVFDESMFGLGDPGYSGKGIYTIPNEAGNSSYELSAQRWHTGEMNPTSYKLYGKTHNPIRTQDLKEGQDLMDFNRSNPQGVPISSKHDAAIRTQRGGIRIAPDHLSYETVFPKSTSVKSALGNNGMFDMSNPNIYKSLVPAAIGAGAASFLQEPAEDLNDNFALGGLVPLADCGGPGQPPCFSFKEKTKNSLQGLKEWVTGNIEEHVKVPLLNIITGGTHVPEYDVQVNRFDNTPGKLPNFTQYKDPETFKKIREYENLSQVQISPEKFNRILQPLRNKNASAMHPMGYEPRQSIDEYLNNWNSEDSLQNVNLSKIGQAAERGETWAQRRIDAFLFYSGLPQRYNTFTVSDHSAGEDVAYTYNNSLENLLVKYLTFRNSAYKTNLYRKLMSGDINPEAVKNMVTDEKGSKINKEGFIDDVGNVMWRATYGIGYDKNNPYISFYDQWDLLGDDLPQILGKEYDIYDRMPLDEQTIKDFSYYPYRPDSLEGLNLSEGKEKSLSYTSDFVKLSKMYKGDLEATLNALKSSNKEAYDKLLGFDKITEKHLKSLNFSTKEIEEFKERERKRLLSFISPKTKKNSFALGGFVPKTRYTEKTLQPNTLSVRSFGTKIEYQEYRKSIFKNHKNG